MESVPPLFIKDQDIGDRNVTPIQLCSAVIRVIGATKLDGIQRINNLWRLYVKDRAARVELYIKQTLLINTKHVPLYDQNPFASNQPGPRQNNDKLTVRNVPLSVSNDEIKKMLEEQNVQLASPIRYGYIRDIDGGLTSYKSGDRFVYVIPFDPPLPRKQDVGMFPCIVIHHGKMTPCIACGQAGHKIGEALCIAKPKEDIMAFKSYQHPLSNHFPCQLEVYDNEFKSLEHAYFWRMATAMGNPLLAAQIQTAKHAGEAKRMSKQIADDETRWKWEKENTEIMQKLLMEKAVQCEPFKNCLLENEDKVLAEATPSKFWASGLSLYVTENTTPNFWPGQNMLGVMLMELAQLLKKETEMAVQSEVNNDKQQQDESNIITTMESEIIEEKIGGDHVHRTKTKSPASDRPSRSFSSPYRRAGRSMSGAKQRSTGVNQATPRASQDIRLAFEVKRKVLASSPGDEDDSLPKKKNGHVT